MQQVLIDSIPQISARIGFMRRVFTELSIGTNKGWLAGGALRSLLAGEKLDSDLDLFFPDQAAFEVAAAAAEAKGATVTFENDNTRRIKLDGFRPIDLVKKFFPSATGVIEAFDFTVSCVAMDESFLYYHDTFFIDLAQRRLMINALPYPLSTMHRVQKYVRRGFRICPQETLKIATALKGVDLPAVGEEATSEFYPVD